MLQPSVDAMVIVTTFVGTLTGLLSFFAVFESTFIRYWQIFAAWRRRRQVKGLVIVPTAEEISRYGIPLFQKPEPEEIAHERNLQRRRNAERRFKSELQNVRLATLALVFVVCFTLLAARFVMLAIGL